MGSDAARMSTSLIKNFWFSLLVLLCVHTAICFVADRIFTERYKAPPGTAPIETTTPEQRARGVTSFTFLTVQIKRPFSIIFYAFAGYVGLLAAAAWVGFTSIQNRE